MARPDKKQFRDLPIRTFTEWSVSDVKQTLREFEFGIFTRAAMLADAITRDDRVSSTLDTRILGVLGLPLAFEPGTGRQAKAVLKEAESAWWTMFPEDTQKELLLWGDLLGVAVGELVWDTGKMWTPRLKVWHPQFLEWRWDERRYYVHTEEGPIPVDPGNGKWILFTPGGDQRPWMGGLIRRLAIPYLIRNFALRDWARYSEVHGLPIRKAKVPSNAKAEDKDTFLSQLGDLGNESVILTPFEVDAKGDAIGFDLALEEAKGDSWEGFERLMDKMETCIAIAILGQNLTTEVKGGSYAAANVHDRVRQDYLEGDAEGLATALHEQALKPWASYNFGAAELAPWPAWDVTPPPQETAIQPHHLEYGLLTINENRARLNLPPIEGGDRIPEPVKQPAAPPPGTPPEKLSQRILLSSGDDPALAPGFVLGQLYADALGDKGRDRGAQALAPDLQAVLSLIAEAEDYEGLRAGLVTLFGEMQPEAMAAVTEKALLLAELAGRHAVLEDV